MIAQLRGKIFSKAPNLVIVEVGGVGFQVFIPLSTFYRLPEPEQEVLLLTRTLLRDEAISLYGFLRLSRSYRESVRSSCMDTRIC